MNQFCGMKGIKREFSVARTPQQNRFAERKNRTLIKSAKTMLVDSLLPTTFWAEAVNTACYVQNRVLVTKPHNKTPYELLHGRPPSISFMRPFGCLVTILNTLNPLGKFDGKADEGFLVGYSINSKAFRVFNTRTRKVEENLHITFLENKPNVAGSGLDWLFDIDLLTNSMNYEPVTAKNQIKRNACIKDNLDVDNTMENVEGDAKTQGRNTAEQTTTAGDTANTASIDVSVARPSNVSTDDPSTSTAGDIFEDGMMTIVDTLVAIRSTRPRTTSVIIHDVEEEPRRSTPAPTSQPSSKDKGKTLMVEPEKPSKNPRKDQIHMDEDAWLLRLHEKKCRIGADALFAEDFRKKTEINFLLWCQDRFLWRNYRKKRFTYNQLKNKSFEEIQKLYEKEQKWIKDFIPMDSEEGEKIAASSKKRPRAEPDEESVKRQKIGETSVVVPVEEVYVEALQVKYPIIDWEVYSQDTRRYWRIIRVGNHTEAYQIFADMLKKFDRDDLVKLWDLVKKRFSTTEPTDDIREGIRGLNERLFETNNVIFCESFKNICMDPLGYFGMEALRYMWCLPFIFIEADSEMSRELLRKIFYQANRPRQGGLLGIRGFYDLMLLVQVCAAAED
ncbi:retrovirus-related pol polyprotein from transposon TNT 1-94 [Tanacetum coccineum]